MPSSKSYCDPFYADEGDLICLDTCPLEELIAMGLLNRQLRGPLIAAASKSKSDAFWDEVLAPFDTAALAGKAEMLGPLWPKYRHRFV